MRGGGHGLQQSDFVAETSQPLERNSAAGVEHAMLMYAPHADVSTIDPLARAVLPAVAEGA